MCIHTLRDYLMNLILRLIKNSCTPHSCTVALENYLPTTIQIMLMHTLMYFFFLIILILIAYLPLQ